MSDAAFSDDDPIDYLRITPSEDPLQGDRVTGQFEQLHGSLRGGPFEVRLTSHPATEEITYLVGTERPSFDALRTVASRIFPDGYATSRHDRDPKLPSADTHAVAELYGCPERFDDWMTRLRPPAIIDAPEQHDRARVKSAPGLPLQSALEALATAEVPMVYQTLLQPRPPWGADAQNRIRQLEHNTDTLSQRVFQGGHDELYESRDSSNHDHATHGRRRHPHRRQDGDHRRGEASHVPGSRIDSILAKSSAKSFDVNARVYAAGDRSTQAVRSVASAFAGIDGDYYEIEPVVRTGEDADPIVEAIENREFRRLDGLTHWLRENLPITGNLDPRIVADATTVAHFALVDGSDLTSRVERHLRTRPSERTGIDRPDAAQRTQYTDGMPIGHPVATDGETTDETIALPPALQPLHVAWFGRTGSGKTISLETAACRNHQMTDGADIIVDTKGDGMPMEYLQAHYARHGHLENVYYFDCADVLPAVSLPDIRPLVDAGFSRQAATENVAEHYTEILRPLMGDEQFDQATSSRKVITGLVKALLDPEHGSDALTQTELYRAARRFRERKTPPEVSDPRLREVLASIGAGDDQLFDRVMAGALNRMQEIMNNHRLATLFDHVAAADDAEPYFDFETILDENAVVLLDLGGLRAESREALTLVLLSNLWTALQRRQRRAPTDADLPLVNLYLEEAASLGSTDILTELLSQSRSFGLSVTMVMQFPGQLAREAPAVYDEMLNNIGTLVVGDVAVDDRLTKRLATADRPPEEVGNLLRSLNRGQWLVDLPAAYGDEDPKPFLVESLDPPAGHPAGDEPLSRARTKSFEATVDVTAERSWRDHGIRLDVDPASETEEDGDEADEEDTLGPEVLKSALPYTARLPRTVTYDPDAHALECEECGDQFAPDFRRLKQAIRCHDSLDAVDRDNIPICDVPLTFSPQDRRDSDYTGRQLAFLQAVYEAQQQRYDSLEYDLVRDSMRQLRTYLDIETAAVQELVTDGLLKRDTKRPHLLYTVTPSGREAIQVSHREGVAHGDGQGDLSESTYHVLLCEVGARLLERRFVDDPDSPATAVRTYHSPDGHDHRLDAAAVTQAGDVVAAVEAERANNDMRRDVPADYDKLATHEPSAAIWLTPNRDTAHDVLEALNDPQDASDPRVAKSYSRTTSPGEFSLSAPGCTELLTLAPARRTVLKTTQGTAD